MSNTRTVTTAVALGACVALAGCAGAPVDERPVVRIVEAAQPSQAIPLGRFLPSAEELSVALGTGPNGFMGQLVEGDADMLLRNADAQATPPDCVGAAYRLQEIVYAASPVQSVTSGSWAGGDFSGPPVSASFGVVQMASAADAEEFFATTTGDWRRCNGQTVVVQHPGTDADQVSRISDVGFDRRVVSANVLHASGASASAPAMRALGLVGDCIVDVELSDPRAAGGASPAVDVAELIVDKIAAHR